MTAATIGDRLRRARRAWFVGRDAELELFGRALNGGVAEPAVLYVHGPGGVGKTTLLAMFAELVAEAGRPLVRLDARTIEASPPGFRVAAGPVAAGSVMLLDTYELLAPLDDWLRGSYLPSLPEDVLVVLAGRDPPAAGWLAELGWRDLLRVVSLRNLRPAESRTYLTTRGVTGAGQDSVVAFTHGHPLALALVADVLVEGEGDALASYRPEQQPDLVRVLLERFVAQVPSPQHRAALDVCAHLRVTTEPLLADALGDSGGQDAADLFGWLRGLSFVECGPEGVSPHDLAREVLDADLRWRNPPGYRRLHLAARKAILRRIQTSRGTAQQRALMDFMFMHRNNPITGRYYDWGSLGHTYLEPATDQDLGQILAIVERYEGGESARIARHWYARQPGAFTAFRNVSDDLIGFLATVTLNDATPEDIAHDPAALAALGYTRRHGPLRAGDELIYHRFFLSRDAYQSVSPATNLLAISCCRHWLTRPRLAWSFLTVADADYWQPLFSHLNFRFSAEAGFEVNGRRYAVFTHDWRAEPPLAWYELMSERELMDEPVPAAPAPSAAPLVVLSEPEFGFAVRRALREYTRPDALATSPLLRSRVLVEWAGPAGAKPGPAELRALLRAAAEAMCANPRDERFYRALRATYLEPAATQERAAERLGLPFSTYRSHLGAGIERVTGWLWRRELSGHPDRAET